MKIETAGVEGNTTKKMKTIELTNVYKSFKKGLGRRQSFIRGLSLAVNQGEIYSLVGPNGSGKTTLVKLIVNLLFADSGDIRIIGVPVWHYTWKLRVGVVPESPALPGFLTAYEYLDYVCPLYEIEKTQRTERIARVLDTVNLYAGADKKIRYYSKGMIKRLALAQALVHEPEVLILDEPLDGLDPAGVALFRAVVQDFRTARHSVFMTTHLLGEIEKYADRIGFIKDGAIVAEDTRENLCACGSLEEQYIKIMQ